MLAVGREPPKTLSKSLKCVPVSLSLSRRPIWRNYPLPLVLASGATECPADRGRHCRPLRPHGGRTGAGAGAARPGREAASEHGRDRPSSLAGAQHPAAAAGRLLAERCRARRSWEPLPQALPALAALQGGVSAGLLGSDSP